MEIEGPVVNIGTNSLEINDPILGTITIVVNEFTRYEDEIDEDNRTFNFEDIVLNMNVEVKFYVDSGMENIATSAVSIKETALTLVCMSFAILVIVYLMK